MEASAFRKSSFLLIGLATSALAQSGIRLSGVPERLEFPIRAGGNLILTAEVEGPRPKAVWLAASLRSKGRVLLSEAGKRRYQINLADGLVSTVLLHEKSEGQFRIFAETDRGDLLQSLPVSFSIRAGPAGRWICFVREAGKYLQAGTSSRDARWLSPEEVDRIELRCEDALPEASHKARAGKVERTFKPDRERRALVLELDPEIRAAWEENGGLQVGPTDGEGGVALRSRPQRLDLAATKAEGIVHQRHSVEVPGSRGYLEVHAGDVTAGQVLLEVQNAEGEIMLANRPVREGDRLPLRVGREEYTLSIERLRNFLTGDDYVVFSVSQLEPAESTRIERLIRRIETSKVVFFREGVEYGPEEATAHIRDKYQRAGPKARNLDEFIEKVASRSWTTGEPYRVKLEDGRTVAAETWLKEQAAALEREGEAAAPDRGPSSRGAPGEPRDR